MFRTCASLATSLIRIYRVVVFSLLEKTSIYGNTSFLCKEIIRRIQGSLYKESFLTVVLGTLRYATELFCKQDFLNSCSTTVLSKYIFTQIEFLNMHTTMLGFQTNNCTPNLFLHKENVCVYSNYLYQFHMHAIKNLTVYYQISEQPLYFLTVRYVFKNPLYVLQMITLRKKEHQKVYIFKKKRNFKGVFIKLRSIFNPQRILMTLIYYLIYTCVPTKNENLQKANCHLTDIAWKQSWK